MFQIKSKKLKKIMYWFSGINNHNKESYFNYIKMYKVAVITAKKTNPNLKPILILDGDEDEYIQELYGMGVKIVKHKSTFYNELKNHYKDNTTAFGAFLRVDIPIICDILNIEDEYVLYTDNDVMFMSDISDLENLKPKNLMCSGEFNPFVDYRGMNTGVMWLNWKSLLNSHNVFTNFIKNNLKLLHVYDQTAYILYYNSSIELLDYRYNYKPYWSESDDMKILHFHGPKPTQIWDDKSINEYPHKSLFTPYFFKLTKVFNDIYDNNNLLNT